MKNIYSFEYFVGCYTRCSHTREICPLEIPKENEFQLYKTENNFYYGFLFTPTYYARFHDCSTRIYDINELLVKKDEITKMIFELNIFNMVDFYNKNLEHLCFAFKSEREKKQIREI